MQALTSPASSASLHRHHPLSAPSSSFSSSSPSTFSYGHRHQWLGKRLLVRRSSSSSSSYSARFRSCSLLAIPTCKVPSLTQENFQDEVLKADLPVLVGFCADWCGPCKLIGPIMESVSKEFEGTLKVLKIDTDSSPDLVKEYDVYGLPTLILFKDGKEVPGSRREGTINAKKLKELLTELLGSAATT